MSLSFQCIARVKRLQAFRHIGRVRGQRSDNSGIATQQGCVIEAVDESIRAAMQGIDLTMFRELLRKCHAHRNRIKQEQGATDDGHRGYDHRKRSKLHGVIPNREATTDSSTRK